MTGGGTRTPVGIPVPVRAHLYESADERDGLVTSVLDLTLDLDLLATAVGAAVKGNFEANWRRNTPEATVRLLTKGRLPRLQIHQIRLDWIESESSDHLIKSELSDQIIKSESSVGQI